MMARLIAWYTALSERERLMVLIGGIAVALIVLIGGVLPLQHAASAAAQRVERKRGDVAFLRAVGPQLAGLRSVPTLRGSLVVAVDRSAREVGLGRALTGSQPSGDGGLRVTLEQTSFDTLVNWLGQLSERYGVRVDSAVIERGNSSGIVNANLVLRAAH
jgi:type II secretory pathway component PulM